MIDVSGAWETAHAFSHEVTFYQGLGGLPRAVVPFVREGLALGETVLVAMVPERRAALTAALGPAASRVEFADMAELGANPARIIPEWRRFVNEAPPGASIRGVGEPVWPGRRRVEIAEAVFHESLLNLAFDEGRAWRLLCPYDETALPADVLVEARRGHPVVHRSAGVGNYSGPAQARETFSAALSPPPVHASRIGFGTHDLAEVRQVVREACRRAAVGAESEDDLVLAAHELATNSVLHGGGTGLIATWREPGALVVEVRDRGRIDDPLVGRNVMDVTSESGRGIWIANQLCDLVQVRSGEAGTQVRLYAWV